MKQPWNEWNKPLIFKILPDKIELTGILLQ